MDINKAFEEFIEKEWHDGHEPQGGHDHYEEEEIDEKKALKLRDLNVYAAPKKKGKKVGGSTAARPMAFGISRKGGSGPGKGYGSAKKAPIMMGDEVDEETLNEFQTVFALRFKGKDGKRYVYPFKSQQKADKKGKEIKSDEGATDISVEKIILRGSVKWKEEVKFEENQIDEILPAIGAAIAKVAIKKVVKKAVQSKDEQKQPKLGEEKMIDEKKETDEMSDIDKARERIAKNKKALGISKDPKKDKDEPESAIRKAGKSVGVTTYNQFNPKKVKEDLISSARKILMGEDSNPDEPGKQGDEKEYQKKRDEILKGYGVKACALIKDEKTKKQCFQDLDDAHVADHEEAYGVEKRAKEPSVKDNAGKCESTMDAYVKKLSEGGYSYNPHPPEGKPTAKVPKAKKSDAKESVKKK